MRCPARWLAAALLVACSGPGADSSPADSPADSEAPRDADVLVIGSGPAGISAAHAASAAGAEVRVLEMDDGPGGGASADRFYAADTRWQAESGVTDSPEAALGDWAAMTGGDPADPWVQRLVHESAGVLEWLVDDLEVTFIDLSQSAPGETPRLHALETGVKGLLTLYEPFVDRVDLLVRADDLLLEGGEVVGVRATDLSTGAERDYRAGAVVVATGGFGRSLERVVADRPELEELSTLYESWPHAQGIGLDMAEAAGANFQNAGAMGVYLHAVPDWRDGKEGEAITLPELAYGIVVDLDGRRVMDEGAAQTFDALPALTGARDRRLFAVLSPEAAALQQLVFIQPATSTETLTFQQAVDAGAIVEAADATGIAAATGVDAAGLAEAIARYDALCAAGADADFGKSSDRLYPLGDGPLYAAELYAGPAKGFGGVELDEDAGVLGADGAAIPGLYAAGEVAGMLGTPAVGRGFEGSITAVYLTGLTAGESAAGYALSSDTR